jgi:hypothetical protein
VYYTAYVNEKLAQQIHQDRMQEAKRHHKYMKARRALRDISKSITTR